VGRIVKRQDAADARAALGLGPVIPRTSAPRSPAKAAARGVQPPATRTASAPATLVKASYYLTRELVGRVRAAALASGHSQGDLVTAALTAYLRGKPVKPAPARSYTRRAGE
jgi:hypothetical protein